MKNKIFILYSIIDLILYQLPKIKYYILIFSIFYISKTIILFFKSLYQNINISSLFEILIRTKEIK
jgi:hypothetical protein